MSAPNAVSSLSDERAAEKIAALSEAAGHLAHDFNNLLAAISGSAALIEMTTATQANAPDVARHVRNIQGATQRGARIMRQLLALSPRTDGLIEPVAVHEILDEVARGAAELLGPTHSLSVFPAGDLPAMQADRGQVFQVLTALIENARDAMTSGGTILITARQTGDRIVLGVQDSGTGFSAEARARAFEPFYTTKPKGKGAGLSLAMVLRVMRRHGGSVEIHSETGIGARVSCSFPVAGAAVAQA